MLSSPIQWSDIQSSSFRMRMSSNEQPTPLAARTVLEDCKQAAAMFTPGLQGSQWRIAYMANVALLRAVYHVLKSRDAAVDPALRKKIETWDSNLLASKPAPTIYWEFIVSERNLLLKEYQSLAGQGVAVPGVRIEVNLRTREERVTCLGEIDRLYTMNGGVFAGRDQRQLIAEAIAWWETQLDSLEATPFAT